MADEAYRLWRIRRTVQQMLKDRNYIVKNEDLNMTFEEFKEKFASNQGMSTKYATISREQLMIMTSKQSDPLDVIFVFFPTRNRLGVKDIRDYHTKMRENNVKRAILVLQPNSSSTSKALSPQARRAIDGLAAHGYIIEDFQEEELLINITEHVLVPKHIPMTDEEKIALLKNYRLSESQLPRIKIKDPIARYYGLQRGQVVRIIRPSETAGRYVTYRVCQ